MPVIDVPQPEFMLQRTPTWMFSRPAKDWIANTLRKILPDGLAYKITRFKNIKMQDYAFKVARDKPQKVKDAIYKGIEKALGKGYDKEAFTPPYNPWEQRLCLVPDNDLFEAMNAGKASVVTGHIEGFEANGIRLKSGELLEADIIITATGLKLAIAGKIAVSHNGTPVEFHVGVVPDSEFERINVEGTQSLIECARAAGVRRFVYTSTTALYGHDIPQ